MVITENGLQSTYYNVRVFGTRLYLKDPAVLKIAAIRSSEYYPH